MTVDEALALVLTEDDGRVYDRVCYGRQSTQGQYKRGNSMPEQKRMCIELALQHGADPRQILWIQDVWSGEITDRPQLNLIRKIHEEGRTKGTILIDPDRFSRDNVPAQILVYEELTQSAPVHFVSGDFEDSDEGRFFFTVKAGLSRLDKAKLLRNMKRGRLGKARRGLIPHGARVYGYKFDYKGTDHQILQERAEVVRFIYERRAEGLGGVTIAAELNYQSIPSPTGGMWWSNTVMSILKNETYRGTLYVNKIDATKVALNKFLRKDEERHRAKLRPRSEWIPIPVPVIIDQDLWERVRRMDGVLKKRLPTATYHTYFLTGLLRCSICGMTMHGTSVRQKNGKGSYYYACRSLTMPESKTHVRWCGQKRVRAELLENLVWERVALASKDPDFISSLAAQHQIGAESDHISKELARLDAQATDLERQRQRVITLNLNGRMTDGEADKQLDSIMERVAQVEGKRAPLRERLHSAEEVANKAAELASYLDRHRENIDACPPEERAGILRDCLDGLMYNPDGTVDLAWRGFGALLVRDKK